MKRNILIITACLALLNLKAEARENLNSNFEMSPIESVDFALLKNTQDKRYIVSLKNSSPERLRLSFMDHDGREIYTELIEGASIYNRRFDLVNLSQGSYSIKLENFGGSVEKQIIIK